MPAVPWLRAFCVVLPNLPSTRGQRHPPMLVCSDLAGPSDPRRQRYWDTVLWQKRLQACRNSCPQQRLACLSAASPARSDAWLSAVPPLWTGSLLEDCCHRLAVARRPGPTVCKRHKHRPCGRQTDEGVAGAPAAFLLILPSTTSSSAPWTQRLSWRSWDHRPPDGQATPVTPPGSSSDSPPPSPEEHPLSPRGWSGGAGVERVLMRSSNATCLPDTGEWMHLVENCFQNKTAVSLHSILTKLSFHRLPRQA